MADNAPALAVGDIALTLIQAIVLNARTATGATSPVQKGDVVSISSNVTDLSYVCEIALAAADDTNSFGVCTDNAFGGSSTVKWTIPVCIHGIVKVTASAAAISKGKYVVAAGGATGSSTVKVVPAGAISDTQLNEVFGYAITDFASGDSGLIMVLK